MKSRNISYDLIMKFTDILINTLLHQYVKEKDKRLLAASNHVYNTLYNSPQIAFLKENSSYFQKMYRGFKFNINNHTYTAFPGENKRYMGIHYVKKTPIVRIYESNIHHTYINETFESVTLFNTNIRILSFRLLEVFAHKFISSSKINKNYLNTTSRISKYIPGAKEILIEADNERNLHSKKTVEFESAFKVLQKLECEGLLKKTLSLFGINGSIHDLELFLNSNSSSYDNINTLMLKEEKKRNSKTKKAGSHAKQPGKFESTSEKDWDVQKY